MGNLHAKQKKIIYDITQPWKTLDKWQIDYINTPPEQDCFLLTGRQSGKTAAMAIKCVEMCVHHFGKEQNVLINSITEKQAGRMLVKALVYARMKYPKKIIEKGRDKPTKHILKFTTGASILSYAAGEAGEGLRGDTIKKHMVDEGSRMSEEFFIATSPMMSVSQGSQDIASTPFEKRHKDGEEKFFYKCSKDEHYKKFYVSAEDCPRHTKEFLEREKARMTKLQYAQEYLAQFLDEVTQFFDPKTVEESCIEKRPETIGKKGTYFLGCDVARKGIDKFTYEIFNRAGSSGNYKLNQVENIWTTNIPIPESVRRIIELNIKYNFKKEYIDSGGMGITVCDLLREDPINKRKVVEINNSSRRYQEDGEEKKKGILKEDLYENLAVLMEQKKITFLDDDEIKASLNSIQYEYSDKGKLIIWGYDDHIVEGLARGAWCSKDKSLNIYFYQN